MAVSTLPDPEALLVTALRAQTNITTLAGQRIATRLGTTFPAIRITLVGGPPRPVNGTGQVELQVDCVAGGDTPQDESAAADLGWAVEAAIADLRGTYAIKGVQCRIVAAYNVGGVIHSPYADTNRQRYIVGIGLIVQ